ncbi:uncharacterized protein LOC105280839 [Ooceraea biroi]|uniref:uncharacterized protein LOC105280839 n=1 Tax=Ooceraea biroi TaxID=2015173 RepID=UPI0005BB0537|nr:uncharacterized protein LOC105280839 [Ooceraea biroi]
MIEELNVGKGTALKPGDIFLVDRGFRDSLKSIQEKGFVAKMPCFSDTPSSSLTTEQANTSRMVTKSRYIVEYVNGWIKNFFQFFNSIDAHGQRCTQRSDTSGTDLVYIKLRTKSLRMFFVSSREESTFEQAQTRVEKLQELWSAFNENQTQIEVNRAKDEEDLEDVTKQEAAEREIFEWAYYKALDEARSIIAAASVPATQQDALESELQGSIDIKLPTLKHCKFLVQPIDKWDTLIIYLARNKLDYQSECAWEEEVGQQKSDHMPTTKEFLKFCSERCRTLEICSEFLRLSVQERLAIVKQKQLCINCLKSGHYAKECKASKCRKCSKVHNTLLHLEGERSSSKKPPDVTPKKSEETEQVMHCVQRKDDYLVNGTRKLEVKQEPPSKESSSQVILATAQVYVRDGQGRRQTCRALLDPGSQSHFVTEELARRLQLPSRAESAAINGIMRNVTRIERSVKVRMESRNTAFEADLECLIISTITEQLPQLKINKRLGNLPQDHRLADPAYDKPGSVDMLIGAGLFWKLLCVGQVKSGKGHPTWQKTQLGWIVGGELFNTEMKTDNTGLVTCLANNQMLNKQLERFWAQEEGQENRQLNIQETYCENYFDETTTRDSAGRFIACPERKELGLAIQDSKQQDDSTHDYKERGHMNLVSTSEMTGKALWFMLHQPVLRLDSITTKLRVVFDASAKSDNDNSLNDTLLTGPNLQNDLLHILLRYRTHRYVITGDIAMMFRQIWIVKEDRTKEDRALFLPAQRALESDFYMDNVLSGNDDLEKVIRLQMQLTALLKRGQFHLRKWRANDDRILSHLVEGKTEELLVLDKGTTSKTLGVLWNQKEDSLQYQEKESKFDQVTKHTVISEIAQIYDPLGLLGPIIIVAKGIIQQLWTLNLQWDESLPQELYSKWKTYRSS